MIYLSKQILSWVKHNGWKHPNISRHRPYPLSSIRVCPWSTRVSSTNWANFSTLLCFHAHQLMLKLLLQWFDDVQVLVLTWQVEESDATMVQPTLEVLQTMLGIVFLLKGIRSSFYTFNVIKNTAYDNQQSKDSWSRKQLEKETTILIYTKEKRSDTNWMRTPRSLN